MKRTSRETCHLQKPCMLPPPPPSSTPAGITSAAPTTTSSAALASTTSSAYLLACIATATLARLARTSMARRPGRSARRRRRCGRGQIIKKNSTNSFFKLNTIYECRCHSGFCPPQKVSPRTQSASGFCPGGHNPLAGTVRGDKIRQRILSGGTCSASGFCPSSAECVPPPPPLLQQ